MRNGESFKNRIRKTALTLLLGLMLFTVTGCDVPDFFYDIEYWFSDVGYWFEDKFDTVKWWFEDTIEAVKEKYSEDEDWEDEDWEEEEEEFELFSFHPFQRIREHFPWTCILHICQTQDEKPTSTKNKD